MVSLRRRVAASVGVMVLVVAGSVAPAPGLSTAAAAVGPWDQLGLDIDGVAAGDQSGFSVAMSADGARIAVGATRDDGTYAGYVRVFEWSDDAWRQVGVDIEAESAADEAGFSVALSADGSRLAVGARLNSDAASLAGHVRVYEWSGSTWAQMGTDIDGEDQFEQSGYSVALSDDGNRLAVGAPGGNSSRGLVRVFTWTGSAWTRLGEVLSGDAAYDSAGWAVALSADGGRLAIGAPGSDAAAPNAGRVTVHAWSGSAWTPLGSVDGEAEDDFAGRSIALSADGSRLAVGAAKNDDAGSDAGHVRVHAWSGSAWNQLGDDIDGQGDNDQSGRAVALSDDGNRLAIGATGTGAGHVRVLLWTGAVWVQSGTNIEGEALDDRSGTSVAMAADGAAVAIGATRNDGAAENAGHVRVHGSLTATPVPDPPSDVTGVAGDGQVAVSWVAPPPNGGPPISSYTVTSSPEGRTCTATETPACIIDGLTNGVAYRFVVTATNAGGTSSAMSGWLTPATLPDPPTGVTASSGADGDATVWWSAPLSDGGAPISAYTVTSSPDGAICTTEGVLTCTVTGLTVGAEHTFQVTATNAMGTGRASAPSLPVAPATTPGAPFDVVGIAGDAEVAVAWTAPVSDGGAPIVAYTVTAIPGGQTCTTTGALACTVTELTNGEIQVFTVTATNSVGTGPASPPSDPVVPAVGAAVVPGAPFAVSATAGDSQATVSWTAPVSDGGAPILAYTATATPGGQTCSTTGALTCTVAGLTNDELHTFTVTATNRVGTGPASAASEAVVPQAVGPTTPSAPGAPTDLTATPGDSQVTLSWAAPTLDGGSAVRSYRVTSAPGGRTCTTTGALSCTVTGLTNGITHAFSVTAANDVGPGPASLTITALPVAPPPPSDDRGSTTAVEPTEPTEPAGLAPCPSPALPFDDTRSVIALADIACIYGLGITTGTSATTYDPDGLVDRNQMASFLARLWRATGQDCPTPTLPFTDIDTVISRADIACIYGLGITTGTSTTTYSPHGLVDRNQMASFLARLWRAAELDCPSPTVPFTDIDAVISRADIACIYGLGITTGTSTTTYSPDGLGGLVDRDQMASFLARLWRAAGSS